MIGTIAVLVIVLICAVVMIVQRMTPSDEVMDLNEYYQVEENEISIFMENQMYEKKGLYIDNTIYIDYDTVVEHINKRFYWDSYENILVYTTPTEIIKAEVGASSYSVDKSETKTEYTIVKTMGDKVYVALAFVKLYSNVEYEAFVDPNRVVITCHWGEQILCSEAKDDLSIRYEASIKSPILAEVKSGDVLVYIEPSEEEGGFAKVMTRDGVIGYAKKKYLRPSYYEELKNDYEEPVYTNISKKESINLVWHQVFNQRGNESLISLLENTKGVNVVSPTWFSIKNEDGEITSLASPKYVERAHAQGADVWALVDDFNTEIDKEKLFGRTSSREKLSNTLIAEALVNNIDGINIDFEKITQASSDGYIQFIRELSVKCRKNGIILSIDNYIPAPYNMFYDREEQGVVADYIICMAYDEHFAGSKESGSVSSINFVKKALTDTLKEVPANKVVMALPFYTRLWKEEKVGAEVKVSSEAYTMQNAENLMKDKGVTLEWDEEIAQYYGEYEQDGFTYKMWLEEEKSYEEKLKAVFSEPIAGVAAWKLGLEKNSIWNVIAKYVTH